MSSMPLWLFAGVLFLIAAGMWLRRSLQPRLQPQPAELVFAVPESGTFVEARAASRETSKRPVDRQPRDLLLEQQRIFDLCLDLICTTDSEGRFRSVSASASRILGYEPTELIGRRFIELVYPDDIDRTKAVHEVLVSGGSVVDFENRYLRKDGTLVDIGWSARWWPDTGVAYSVGRDITNRKRAEAMREAQSEVLRLIVARADLPLTLERICSLVETFDPSLTCAVVLLAQDREHIGPIVALRLPAPLIAAQQGAKLGSTVGSCSGAMSRGANVISRDIATDPHWVQSRELALEHGLRACWSMPVLGARNEVMATVDVYAAASREPTARQLDLLQVAARHVSVAVEHARADSDVKLSLARIELAQSIARLGYWERDVAADSLNLFGDTCSILGWPRDKPLDLESFMNLVVEEDRPVLTTSAADAVQRGEVPGPLHYRIRRANDGQLRHIFAERRALRDEAGRIVRMLGTLQDVTDQYEAATRLRKSEERFRVVVEQTGQLMLDCDLDTRRIVSAGAVRELLGIEPDALATFDFDGWLGMLHPEDLPGVERALQRTMTGQRVVVEFRLRRADGCLIHVEATCTALRDVTGRPHRVIAAVSNISERHRSEADRRRYLAQLAFLADAARKVNSILTVEELLQAITDAARDLLDAEFAVCTVAREAAGKPSRSLSLSAKYASLVQTAATETPVFEVQFVPGKPVRVPRRTGERSGDAAVKLQGAGSLTVSVLAPGGLVVGEIRVADKRDGDFTFNDERVLGQLADLAGVGVENARLYAELEARVRRRTQELEQSNRELEAFSYSVSHDLRGPLRAIAGFTGLLRERYYDTMDGDSRRYIDRVLAATNRMSSLIDDLLELGRVTRVEINREEVDLSALAQSIVSRFRERAPQRVVRVTIELGLRVHGDLRLMEIALENLLENAWKFTAERASAEIRFGAKHVEGERTFYIEDNGVGFDPQYASNLFGVFQRLHAASEFPGTGVGLATVQRIVQRHGGRVWADAEVDRGATFFFTIAKGQQ